jgi:transcriptional regulator with XRE-family HTH domain
VRRADPAGAGLTHGHLATLIAGRARPSRRALESIARALELEPDYFAEYRLAELRDQLDERRAGFDAAYRRLPHAHASRVSVAGARRQRCPGK